MNIKPLTDAERIAFEKLCNSQGKTVEEKTAELMRDFLLTRGVKRQSSEG